MMQTVNERLRDESIAHAVWITISIAPVMH